MDEIEKLKARFDGIKHINLTESQTKAVCNSCGNVLVLAVPGSGKTTVLVMHLGHLIYNCGVAPENVLTMTYTVAAAQDMRRRFVSFFGSADIQKMQFRTINGVCAKIISQFEYRTGRTAFDVLSDEKHIGMIISDILKKYLSDYPSESDIQELRRRITYAKNMMLTADEIKAQDEKTYPFSKMFSDYCDCLKRARLMDYDDQMVYALKILKSHPDILERISAQYKYILVDEAQDTSKIQHTIIDLISLKNGNLFMVGDEDQSIYGFRAAYPEALIEFEKNHENARVMYLEKNFRSDGYIVETANRFINNNRFRYKKTMISFGESCNHIKKAEFDTRSRQYDALCRIASECVERTAVLYRDNESAVPLVDRLERAKIPYSIKSQEIAFFTNRVVLDVREIINFAFHQDDTTAFLRLYFKLGTYLSRELALKVCEYSREESCSVFIAIKRLEGIPRSTRENCAFIESALNALARAKGAETMRLITYSLNYREYAEKMNLGKAKLDILNAVSECTADAKDFLLRLDYLRSVISEHGNDPACPFILSTVHSSKGLEYDSVYLTDVCDGTFPENVPSPVVLAKQTKRLTADELASLKQYEEERRLFYVAMTRARKNLTVFTYKVAPSSFALEVFSVRPAEKDGNVTTASRCPLPSSADSPKNTREFLSTLLPGTKLRHVKFGKLKVINVRDNIITVIDENGDKRFLDAPSLIRNNLVTLIKD